jgi:putative flippase GtrA
VTATRPLSERGLALLRSQPIRYLMVGGFNTVLGFTLFTVQVLVLQIPYLAALVVSHVVGVTVAFLLYRRFVFGAAGGFWLDYVRCHGVYLGQFALSGTLLVILAEVFGLAPVLAMAVTLVTTVTVSFFGHKHISFRRRL